MLRYQNRSKNVKTRISQIAILIVVSTYAVGVTASAQASEPTWGAALFGTRVAAVNGPPLEVAGVTERSGRLVGFCMLANVPSGAYDPVKLVIKGKWRQGFFWPEVIAQVGNEYKGPWRTVRRQSKKQRSATLVVEPGKVITELSVTLDPFREYIGKYEVGRILLPSGDGGVFELSVLKPPEKPPRL